MATRRWLALVLFVAVFSMHGIQCVGAESMTAGSGHAMTASGAASGAPADLVMQAAHAADAFGALPAAAIVDVGATVAPGSIDSDSHPTGLMDHLWAVCLAVLSVFMAGLLAVLVVFGMRSRLPLRLGGRPGRMRARVPLPRPSLSALCVLRI